MNKHNHNRFMRKIARVAKNLKRASIAYMDLKEKNSHEHSDFESENNTFAAWRLIGYDKYRIKELSEFVNNEAAKEGLLTELVLNANEKNSRYTAVIAPSTRGINKIFWKEHTFKFIDELPRWIKQYQNKISGYFKKP